MLNMDPVVQVNVSVGAGSAIPGTFDVGALLTPESGTGVGTQGAALSSENRYAAYSSLAEVLNGIADVAPKFASTSKTYQAAEKYFGVSPAPAKLIVIFFDGYEDALAYDNSKTYALGARCRNNSKLYSCISAIETAEEWTAAHWSEIESPETPVTALLDAIENGAELYGVSYIPITDETAANVKTYSAGIVSALESLGRGCFFYGVIGTGAAVTDASGLLKAMATSASKRGMGICSKTADEAPGLMGLAMGLARTHQDTSFAMCYKAIGSATASDYTQSEIEAIKALNGNVYVARTKTRAGLENGAVASGLRFDEVLYLDQIAYDLQTSLYAMIADNDNKLPQNDTTTTLFISEINRILEGYYRAGVLADAAWRGAATGSINQGDMIEHGYAAFAESFDQQSAADRALHKAMPITVLLCLSGSVESIVLYLDVQT